MSISIRNDPACRWVIGSVLGWRIALSLWAFTIVQLYPFLVANLTLFGEPIVTGFDLRTSDRFAYTRAINGRELHMRSAAPGIVDAETATYWNRSGEAISGTLVGSRLETSKFPLEQIFPYVGTSPAANALLAVWQRFDTNWYLKIALFGYAPDDGSAVYFPLYPLLIRALGMLLFGNFTLAALAISTLALIGALILLYHITMDLTGPAVAQRAIFIMLLFPTAFFLLSGYTEALFLFLSLASLRQGMRRSWLQAGIWGALAALTRLQGVLLFVPLAYMAWRNRRELRPHVALILLVPLATLSYFVWQYSIVGNGSLFGAYEGQLHARFVLPWDNVAAAVSLLASGRGSLIDGLNLLVTVVFGGLLVAVWRLSWMPKEFGLYSVAMYLAPLFRMTTEQPLVSMARYVLVLFPVFIALGFWTSNRWIRRAVVYSSMPFALYLSAQFVMWGWVG